MAAASPWEISATEHQANMAQFQMAGPVGGKLPAQSARNVLLKSNLPANILAQIWALSDLDKDGQLDPREFSIAMRLTRNCIAGLQLPSTLPPSMLGVSMQQNMSASVPMSVPYSTSPSMAMGTPPLMGMSQPPMPPYSANTAPAAVLQKALHENASQGPYSQGRPCGNWTIPQQKKLHYCQQFNNLDKQRVGFLTGQVARNAMGQSGLSMPTLAHIWYLSDVNRDGRLSVDEFCIASHLIDMHKSGFALTDATPQELLDMCGGARPQTASPQMVEPGAAPPQKVTSPKSFEDKRRDNFDRGQAELERRRQILQEEEERRRAEIQRREREEAERKERERQEKERKREEERQREMERQRLLEEQRMEEQRKREAEMEAIRREQEKQRKVEADKARARELQAQKQAQSEATVQRQQRQKTLGFQLQALDEKTTDVNEQITQARGRIEEITKAIEGMRASRDEKLQRTQQLQAQQQQLSVQSQELAHAVLQLQSANKETTARLHEVEQTENAREAAVARVEQLKKEVELAKERTQKQKELVKKKQQEMDLVRPEQDKVRNDYTDAVKLLMQLQQQAQQKLAERAEKQRLESVQKQQQNNAFVPAFTEPAAQKVSSPVAEAAQFSRQDSTQHSAPQGSSSGSNPLPTASTAGTARYRAKYEFIARTEDELSFQEGDILLVFEGHASEPGWLAGQIREKVGWFPAAFAEPIAPINTNIAQPIQSASEVTPSASLEKIVEEQSEQRSAVTQDHAPVHSSPEVVICTCTAQFPWKARNEGDLSFAKGDTIQVLEQHEMKWKGRKEDGSVGWFPRSYVKVAQESAGELPRQNSSVTSSSVAPTYDLPPGDVPISTAPNNNSAPMYDCPPGDVSTAAHHAPLYDAPPGDVPTSNSERSLAEAAWKSPQGNSSPPAGDWCVALYDFEAVEETDLPFKIGDRILVTEQHDQWWKGTCNGREGIFPANYVEKMVQSADVRKGSIAAAQRARAIADFTASAANQLNLSVGDMLTIRSRSEQGWWEGEMQKGGQTLIGWFPANYVQVQEDSLVAPSATAHSEIAVALFDYEASQHDELSFTTGEKIVVTAHNDSEWWTGHRLGHESVTGLFPCAYVQICAATPEESLSGVTTSTTIQTVTPKSIRMAKLTEELLQTEERYLDDLSLAKRLFHHNLSTVASMADMNSLCLNWDQLVALSKRIRDRLAQGNKPGTAFLCEIDGLHEFVTFCSQQQAALETLNTMLQDSNVRHVYSQCCMSKHARGMTLNYFLLLPLGRITRYPLLFEKMLKCDPDSEEFSALEMALSVVKGYVEEINRKIDKMDNVTMLCWCQQHVHSIQPPIEFASQTRLQGDRRFIHSGVLYKARSGRLLVALLFNDFFLLTTPDEPIQDVEAFKMSKAIETTLTMYRNVIPIDRLHVAKDAEETQFSLKYGDTVVYLRAPTQISRQTWMRKIEQTIDECAATIAEQKRTVPLLENPSGRLLVEIMSVNNVDPRVFNETPIVCRFGLNDALETSEFEASQIADLKVITQFPIVSTDGFFRLGLFSKRTFSPDVLLFDEVTVALESLISEGTKHKGPIRKHLHLMSGSKSVGRHREEVVIKFVVQITSDL